MNFSTSPTTQFTLANLTNKQRSFLEYFYINVYDPNNTSNLWNPSLGTCDFSRSLIKSICKKYGYSGTIHWIVRKRFSRRTDRGLYSLPELKELHDLWESSDIIKTIITHNFHRIAIERKNKKPN